MERLVQGPITLNSSLHVEHLGLYSLGDLGYNAESLNEQEEEGAEANYASSTASLDEYNMPFLEMLQSPPLFFSDFQQPKPCEGTEMGETQIQGLEINKEAAQNQVSRKKRKRKRARKKKNKEEAESQRMTHIAVERNRRRQMNDHLTALRSLMPTSYVQRGHQASIIGGAIDFVTDLERVLNSLEAQKRTRLAEEGGGEITEVTVVEADRVSLKVRCRRRSGQLVRAIVALEEELRLTVMQLDISSPSPEMEDTVLYSFNLKIENDCGLGSVEQIEAAVQQIFSLNNAT